MAIGELAIFFESILLVVGVLQNMLWRKMTKLGRVLSRFACSLAMSTAKKSVGSMCLIILHQPKVPVGLKERSK